jgi:hypothetical protein
LILLTSGLYLVLQELAINAISATKKSLFLIETQVALKNILSGRFNE